MPYSQSESKQLGTFGARVCQARLDLGWSQEELAFRSGLHRTIEAGRGVSTRGAKRAIPGPTT